jgi:hypothetical protein
MMLARLFVLALLTQQPLSGYDIQRYFALNHIEQWAPILLSSIHPLPPVSQEELSEEPYFGRGTDD